MTPGGVGGIYMGSRGALLGGTPRSATLSASGRNGHGADEPSQRTGAIAPTDDAEES
jgi:hypothetical protein